jgi:hypothetical protein
MHKNAVLSGWFLKKLFENEFEYRDSDQTSLLQLIIHGMNNVQEQAKGQNRTMLSKDMLSKAMLPK